MPSKVTTNYKPQTANKQPANGPLVGIVMGSESDLEIMNGAAEMLRQFEVEPELTIVSAHRTPERLRVYAQKAKERGVKVIIAGAGGAAHLPGMIAANTILPVIGVPVKSSNSIDGWDSMLSILQMPYGPGVTREGQDPHEPLCRSKGQPVRDDRYGELPRSECTFIVTAHAALSSRSYLRTMSFYIEDHTWLAADLPLPASPTRKDLEWTELMPMREARTSGADAVITDTRCRYRVVMGAKAE